MSRFIAITILLAVMTPTFPLFASTPHSVPENLPACCRRDGKHHCAMMMAGMPASSETQVGALPPMCPFRANPVVVSHVVSYLPEVSTAIYAGLLSHPAIHEQTFAAFRVAQARSHLKRGPPLQARS